MHPKDDHVVHLTRKNDCSAVWRPSRRAIWATRQLFDDCAGDSVDENQVTAWETGQYDPAPIRGPCAAICVKRPSAQPSLTRAVRVHDIESKAVGCGGGATQVRDSGPVR